ncbi:unnamed protein product [Peniophora sp. CBMAI 1063]|nr:unnamed protein product [Peniophora sp. CBMAI 1063]
MPDQRRRAGAHCVTDAYRIHSRAKKEDSLTGELKMRGASRPRTRAGSSRARPEAWKMNEAKRLYVSDMPSRLRTWFLIPTAASHSPQQLALSAISSSPFPVITMHFTRIALSVLAMALAGSTSSALDAPLIGKPVEDFQGVNTPARRG